MFVAYTTLKGQAMSQTLVAKIIAQHLVEGQMTPGAEIGVRIDQTLTQDATGTMTYLQFEAIGLDRVRTELSVSYVDHNMLQTDFRNADDHRYLQTVAARHGIHFSRPGNGICHQVHLERFGVPGKTLLGADSHTPTSGGLGMLAMGAGGLDVAVAMAGQPYYLPMPEVVLVRLTGAMAPWVSAKDVILELLRRLSVKGGVGRVFEYGGPGIAGLTVPQRATITNMGAELGATSSLFPSDEQTRRYLAAQGRERDWLPLSADPDAAYDVTVEIDLSTLEPLVAFPHMPDRVVPVREAAGIPVDQVCVGSCTNSSVVDLETVAALLKGRVVAPGVSLTVSPGSRQALAMIAESGALHTLIEAGARILDAGCGPCIGMGQSPASGAASLRSFNRNFKGRSGTADAGIYLAGAEVCAASAITGVITDPRTLGVAPAVAMPVRFAVDDRMIIPPPAAGHTVDVVRGPNIKPLPTHDVLEDTLQGEVLLVTGDNITTDDIMPAGSQVLPFRSNIPAMSHYVFGTIDKTFPERAKAAGGGFVIGGENYGQGSSREHAALVPMYLGVKGVIARSFARIHHANLANVGIVPMTFADPSDAGRIDQGDLLSIRSLGLALRSDRPVVVENVTKGSSFQVSVDLSPRQIEVLLAGGTLNHIKINS
jgi:aconitate hydratase